MPILGSSSSGGSKPTTPTIGTATSGNGSASVPFTASSYVGKGTITYTATSNPGGFTGTGSSPITVSGLTNGTSYTFTVVGTTNYGISSEVSGASNSVAPGIPQGGFMAGGSVSGGRTSSITKLTFDTETSSDLSAKLSRRLNYVAAFANSGVAGYVGGGATEDGGNGSRIDKFVFATETNSELMSLGGIRYYLTGFSNSGTAGYYAGGNAGNINTSSIIKLTFSGETLSTISAVLSSIGAGQYNASASNSGTAGYISGGEAYDISLAYVRFSKIDKLTFSNDTRSTLSHTYSPNRNSQSGFANSGTAAYFAGGASGVNGSTSGNSAFYSSIEKLTFSNDSVSTLGATLTSVNRWAAGYAKSGTAGYIQGGYDNPSYLNRADKITFSNDSKSTLAATFNPKADAQGFANSGTL
jgi:hypothetical protein